MAEVPAFDPRSRPGVATSREEVGRFGPVSAPYPQLAHADHAPGAGFVHFLSRFRVLVPRGARGGGGGRWRGYGHCRRLPARFCGSRGALRPGASTMSGGERSVGRQAPSPCPRGPPGCPILSSEMALPARIPQPMAIPGLLGLRRASGAPLQAYAMGRRDPGERAEVVCRCQPHFAGVSTLLPGHLRHLCCVWILLHNRRRD